MRPLLANRANVVHGSNRSGSITSVSISSYNIRPQPVALSQTKHDILTVVLDTLPLLQNLPSKYAGLVYQPTWHWLLDLQQQWRCITDGLVRNFKGWSQLVRVAMQSITGAAFFVLLLSASCILLLRILFLLTCFVARSDSDSRHLRIFKQYTCELACSSKRAFRIFVFFYIKGNVQCFQS